MSSAPLPYSAALTAVPAAVVHARGMLRLDSDGVIENYDLAAATALLREEPHLMLGRGFAQVHLGLRDLRAYDLLELFAFVRPTRFCLPTAAGLAQALAMPAPGDGREDVLGYLHDLGARMLSDLASDTYRYRAGALRLAGAMADGGWCWGPIIRDILEARPISRREEDGLKPWLYMKDWEDEAEDGPELDEAVSAREAEAKLADLVGSDAEKRDAQYRYAASAAGVFQPRRMEGEPNTQILEAGTGTGKTLGYIAPASIWAEKNQAAVWLSTYTKNLQRQLDAELSRLFPDPKEKNRRVVVRKGRENYACLLNIEETLRAVSQRARPFSGFEDADVTLLGIALRWARFTRSGDMIGGDFPTWLGTNFGLGKIMGLADRRGECLHAGCAHYRKCYIEKVTRSAKHADLVVANHALVMTRAVSRPGDPDLPKRIVFDEGHHVFEAADSSFSLTLSGLEGAELRRWLRGKESGGATRARGLKARLEELLHDHDDALRLVDDIRDAAQALPGEGWLARVTGAAPISAFERFLAEMRVQILARAPDADSPYGLECTTKEPDEKLFEAASALSGKLALLEKPMKGLVLALEHILSEDADILESSTRGRLEAAARGLSQRRDMLRGWRAMLGALDPNAESGDTPAEETSFVDWFELDRIAGRERDIGYHRHYLDPTKPLADHVLRPAHGVIFTSATLRDRGAASLEGDDEAWRVADMRVGAQHMLLPPQRFYVDSPFDYAARTRVLVVNDVNKANGKAVAAAYRALFTASQGGALGLFTAIQRLRAVYDSLYDAMEASEIPLYAQHIDPVDIATLVDMFRSDEKSCLLGTDAVRDGVDVPGRSLRLIVFDRVPWPRPTILHKARRQAFGGKAYDEMLARLKIAQAFGRLVRRKDDWGSFVILDGQTPSRLLTGLPEGVEVERVGLSDAVAIIRDQQEMFHKT